MPDTPSLTPITPAQGALLPAAEALHQLYITAQPNAPYQVRSYQLHAGDPLFGEAQRLLRDMGKTSVPTYRISIDETFPFEPVHRIN
ncbi:hypothetical protein Deipr_2376 (plasmid) [Deinococcus proteolyticus MRP]|uniref:Uncharacterized protein n=1 Tax=Deinococcus proteolyticus (strain ATCC 35074 / DSM 20540 / JCM 6276 / NBRC 101906 / NCIMB 13154 / VKM Ac-1939 / CCM 2703 / MRP) TaxID=693977 RepID=F0RQE1_DEIPM|nr:hypothetical protein [Deinococcus proteolyticus]ADY27500.1 hypothetical protein Deipr_2376 [Deinococcus proteolyticus MRP]